jgi:hypothetical protein
MYGCACRNQVRSRCPPIGSGEFQRPENSYDNQACKCANPDTNSEYGEQGVWCADHAFLPK